MFQKAELNSFRKDFEQAVKGLEEKYGVKLELHSISYSDIEFHTKLTATKVGETGEKKIDVAMFNTLKKWLGLESNLGDSYSYNGKTYTIYDLDPKKAKYPVLLKGSDGKNYKNTVEAVNRMMARKVTE
jgi:hypothetical protein